MNAHKLPSMKMNTSYLIALSFAFAVILWFFYGSVLKKDKGDPKPSAPAQAQQALPSVEIETLYAQDHQSYIRLHGRSEAIREVALKAQTAGIVSATPVREGTYIGRGTLVCKQDVDAREAFLDQANAELRVQQLEYEAALSLVKKGFKSSTQTAAILARLDGAKAQVKRAQIELDNINIRAPFSGIFERQIAEVGDYLAPGQPCGLLVDLDPMIIVGDVTERQVGALKTGQEARIKLATGESVEGKIRLIETKANPSTRTFRIEIAVPNPKGLLKAGVSANLQLKAGNVRAHFIPASVLSLNDTGVIGVRYLDKERIVHFVHVETIDETQKGIWAVGLPERIDLIVRGQDFVAGGTKVLTQYDAKQPAPEQRSQDSTE